MNPDQPTTSKMMLEGDFGVDGRGRIDAMKDGGKVIFVGSKSDTERRRALGGEGDFKGFAIARREEGRSGIKV